MSYLTSINVYLSDENGPNAPEGPGWYAYVLMPDGTGIKEVVPRVRLNPVEASSIAALIDKSIEGKAIHPTPGVMQAGHSVSEAVRKGNHAVKAELAKQIAEAEDIAKNIARLRRGLAEYDEA